MRNGLTLSITALLTVTICSSVAAAQGSHDPHDLSGVWTKTWRTLSLSNEPPAMTPWGQARFDANKPSYGPRAVPPALGNDPRGIGAPHARPSPPFGNHERSGGGLE